MDTQHQEFRIGLTVLVALAALVFLIVAFGKGPAINFGDEYAVRVRFQRTPGISKKSPVFKNGVQIGRVSKVELVDNDHEVEITIRLPKNRKIYTNEECRVRQTFIMGDASLEFVKKPNFTGKVQVVGPDSPPLVGGTPSDLLSGFSSIEGDLSKAINNVSDAAIQMSGFIERANHFIGTPDELTDRKILLDSITQEIRLTMESTRKFTDGANNFLNDPQLQSNIKKVAETMPEIIDKTNNLVTQTNQFVQDARSLMERGTSSLDKIDAGLSKADKALDSVIKITGSVEGNVDDFMLSLKNSAAKLESLFDEITTIIQAVNNADGTLKRIMRSPEMYEKMMETLDNVQQITGQVDQMLKTDIKPIAYNVKIITDKVARDPSVFIRNLIRKQPRTKGHLPIWGDGLGSDTLGDLTCNLDRFSDEALYRNTVYCDSGLPGSSMKNGMSILSPSSDEVYDLKPAPYDSIPDAPTLDSPKPDESKRPAIGTPTLAPEQFDTPNTSRRRSSGQRVSNLLPKVPGTGIVLPSWPLFGKKTTPITTDMEDDIFEQKTNEQEQAITLNPPKPMNLTATEESEEIPEEGKIICVDPRYITAEHTATAEKPIYRQMSYVEDSTEESEPKLRFTTIR